MLRWMTPFLVAIFAIGTAAAEGPGATKTADGPAAAKPADSPPPPSPPTAQPAVKPANSPAAAKRVETRRRQARHGPRRQPIAAGPAPRPLQIPDHGCARRRTALRAPRPHAGGRGRGSRRAVHAGRASVPYAPRVFGTPLLPGSSTLPGYYGTSHSYSYDGPYYGGPLYALTGTACPTPAACTDIASAH